HGFEKGLAPYIKAITGEKQRQDHGDHKLRYRAQEPYDQRVRGILEYPDDAVIVRSKKCHEVFEADKIRTYLREAIQVAFKETVVDRQKLRNKTAQDIYNKKRRYEQIAPLGIAD